MPKVAVLNMQGANVGEIELSEAVFGAEVNIPVMHQVVRSQLNAKRQGTQSALTRTEVRGGGRKIYRQKGTGNARHHGRRAPQFTHGGMVFAVKPRSYRFSVPRKVRRLAMKSALTCKVVENEMIVLDSLVMNETKTKTIATMLKALGCERKALIVIEAPDDNIVRSARNIEGVKTAYINTINVLDILKHDKLIMTREAVKQVEEVYAE
ncbi:MAG: 50S ribosomal protein L4 [Clostridia bacterium]|nr:50S ribosomal protein L4 [Clostridia bacterium]